MNHAYPFKCSVLNGNIPVAYEHLFLSQLLQLGNTSDSIGLIIQIFILSMSFKNL